MVALYVMSMLAMQSLSGFSCVAHCTISSWCYLTLMFALLASKMQKEKLNDECFALTKQILCSFSNKHSEEVMEFTFMCRWSEFMDRFP